MVGRLEIIRESHGTTGGLALAQHLEFSAAFRDELILVLRGICGGGGVRHGSVVRGSAHEAADLGLKDKRVGAKRGILGGEAFARDVDKPIDKSRTMAAIPWKPPT
jgi:hypothetical protein